MGGNIKRKIISKTVTSTGLKRLLTLNSDSWLSSYVDDHLVKNREPRIDKGWFHPSELSSPCDRRLAFSFLGISKQDKIAPRTLRIFHNGDMVHRRWQSYFRAMGILVNREAKFEIAVPPIRGSADAIIRHPVSGDLTIVEIKSINSNGFGRLIAPRLDHANQLNIYMGGHRIHSGVFLYENKDTQETKYFPVKYDQTKFEQLQFRLLKILKKLDKGEMPDIYEHDGCPSCPYFAAGCFNAGNKVESISERMK